MATESISDFLGRPHEFAAFLEECQGLIKSRESPLIAVKTTELDEEMEEWVRRYDATGAPRKRFLWQWLLHGTRMVGTARRHGLLRGPGLTPGRRCSCRASPSPCPTRQSPPSG